MLARISSFQEGREATGPRRCHIVCMTDIGSGYGAQIDSCSRNVVLINAAILSKKAPQGELWSFGGIGPLQAVAAA
jgi:hypothetical protein